MEDNKNEEQIAEENMIDRYMSQLLKELTIETLCPQHQMINQIGNSPMKQESEKTMHFVNQKYKRPLQSFPKLLVNMTG